MKFESEKEKEEFLNNVPFFKNSECFCLGSTLEEAATIVKQVVTQEKGCSDVGLDFQ